MILSDAMIRTRLADHSLTIEPYDDRCVQPASYDLTLGEPLWLWPTYLTRDPRRDQSDVWRHDSLIDGAWTLFPNVRYLGVTAEEIHLPADLAGQLSARSSWGRDGLSVICGPAGWLDPGYRGRPTLELSVIGSPLVIWPGASCLQLVLYQLAAPADRPYGHPSRSSKYQGHTVPTASRAHEEAR